MFVLRLERLERKTVCVSAADADAALRAARADLEVGEGEVPWVLSAEIRPAEPAEELKYWRAMARELRQRLENEGIE